MPQFFTYCWQHREVLGHRAGGPIGFAYGSQFARRGVCPGDEVYIVSVHGGRVHLLGKMLVRAVTHSADDCRRLAGAEPQPAPEYLVAEACTPARLVQLPNEVARGLRFLRGKRTVGLTFREGALVDRQSLRSVRRLSAESAAALDELLPAPEPFRPATAVPPHQPLQPAGPGTT
jgi:hypothetical protein